MEDTHSHIDVAIITALKVEREAICRHLEDVRKVQDEGEAFTYFRGQIMCTNTDECYEVVVIQLAGMGNLQAGIHTTTLLKRWQPQVVLMVGIAGGIRGKVQLGDVVVADAVHYYELSKITEDGEQRRPQEIRSDRLLYNRAQFYEGSDWKHHIGEERPGSQPLLPEVHFGVIAAGEKVIADASALNRLVQEQPLLRAVAMEGAGVAYAALQDASRPWFLEVRGVCDYADASKADDWQPYAAATAAAFVAGLLRDRPFTPKRQDGGAAPPAHLLVLRAQSLRPIDPAELLPALSTTSMQAVESVTLDFTDLVEQVDRLTQPQVAACRLADPHGALFLALARRDRTSLAFHGLVHIPLAVLAGYLVTDRQPVRLFDYHPSAGRESWQWPSQVDGGPPFLSSRAQASPMLEGGVAVVRIAVSYAVSAQQTRAVIPAPFAEVDLTVPEPRRSIVTSEAQVRRYGALFRSELDHLARIAPRLERIHLFYAGPVALAFHLGQQISANIHPPVTVWNYRHGNYEWGLDLTAAALQLGSIITPADIAATQALVALREEEPA